MRKSIAIDRLAVQHAYLRNLMLDAWEIARSGAGSFGGEPFEYIPEAMNTPSAATKASPRAWPTAVLSADFRPRL